MDIMSVDTVNPTDYLTESEVEETYPGYEYPEEYDFEDYSEEFEEYVSEYGDFWF